MTLPLNHKQEYMQLIVTQLAQDRTNVRTPLLFPAGTLKPATRTIDEAHADMLQTYSLWDRTRARARMHYLATGEQIGY